RERHEHARRALRLPRVDVADAPARDRAHHERAVGDALDRKLRRVTRRAGDLQAAVDAVHRSTDGGPRCWLLAHGVLPGLAARVNARTMARRPSSILKTLCS